MHVVSILCVLCLIPVEYIHVIPRLFDLATLTNMTKWYTCIQQNRAVIRLIGGKGLGVHADMKKSQESLYVLVLLNEYDDIFSFYFTEKQWFCSTLDIAGYGDPLSKKTETSLWLGNLSTCPLKSKMNSITHRWSRGTDEYFHATYYDECNHSSMMDLKLNHESKQDPDPCSSFIGPVHQEKTYSPLP